MWVLIVQVCGAALATTAMVCDVETIADNFSSKYGCEAAYIQFVRENGKEGITYSHSCIDRYLKAPLP